VRFPKAAVEPGILGGLRRCFGVLVDLRQREMPIRKSETRPEITLHPLGNGVREAAMRALVIAIFEKRHRRVIRTLNMVAGVDRDAQERHCYFSWFCKLSRASRMPSAPGLTAIGER
jgi:hypothetical protein